MPLHLKPSMTPLGNSLGRAKFLVWIGNVQAVDAKRLRGAHDRGRVTRIKQVLEHDFNPEEPGGKHALDGLPPRLPHERSQRPDDVVGVMLGQQGIKTRKRHGGNVPQLNAHPRRLRKRDNWRIWVARGRDALVSGAMKQRHPFAFALLALVIGCAVLAGEISQPAAHAQPAPAPTQVNAPSVGRIDTSQPPAAASGFWTSRAPAKGGAYRYPLLILGGIVVLATGGLLIIGLRRVGRSRDA